MKQFMLVLTLGALLAAACAPTPGPAFEAPSSPAPNLPEAPVTNLPGEVVPLPSEVPFEPQPGDTNLLRAAAFVHSADLLIMESYPVQVSLQLKGSLPTPCHQLRIGVSPPDEDNRIVVDVYSVVDPDAICVQVLADFETSVHLGSFPPGRYSVWMDGKKIGEFDS